MATFESFGFSDPILRAIGEMGFETATPVQEQTFPILLAEEDTDFLGLAQTGTGKTAAFGLPLLERIDPKLRKTQGVILSPTRELCQQICQQMFAFTKYLGKVDMVPVFGGASISGQIKDIKKGPQVIVGTPGRFIDLLNRGVIKLDHLDYIILDEADEMLNMGFREDIDEILSFVEGEVNTWLFSATMPKEIRRIIKAYMTDPQEVKIKPEQTTNKDITHMYSYIQGKHKHDALKRIIDVNPDMYGIVFCKTKRDTEEVAQRLTEDGYRADFLNGDLSQGQRDKVMGRFKKGLLNLLIATDVAARGIDVNNLTHVIHFSLPDQLENYTHRSGRTGRAGNKGISISLISGKDRSRLKYLERTLDIEVEYYKIPLYSEVSAIRVKHWLESLVDIDESALDLDEKIEEYLNDKLKKVTKAALVKKLLAKDGQGSNGGYNIEDLNADPNSRGRSDRSRGRDRDRRRGRDERRNDRRRDRDERRGDRRGDRRSGDNSRDRVRGRDRDGYRVREDRRERDRGREKRSYGEDRVRSPKQDGMTTFTLDIGSNVLSNKGHLLRLLCDESGLNKSCFGSIEIRKKESKITIGEDFAEDFKNNFKGTRVQGQKVKIAKRGFEDVYGAKKKRKDK